MDVQQPHGQLPPPPAPKQSTEVLAAVVTLVLMAGLAIAVIWWLLPSDNTPHRPPTAVERRQVFEDTFDKHYGPGAGEDFSSAGTAEDLADFCRYVNLEPLQTVTEFGLEAGKSREESTRLAVALQDACGEAYR